MPILSKLIFYECYSVKVSPKTFLYLQSLYCFIVLNLLFVLLFLLFIEIIQHCNQIIILFYVAFIGFPWSYVIHVKTYPYGMQITILILPVKRTPSVTFTSVVARTYSALEMNRHARAQTHVYAHSRVYLTMYASIRTKIARVHVTLVYTTASTGFFLQPFL